MATANGSKRPKTWHPLTKPQASQTVIVGTKAFAPYDSLMQPLDRLLGTGHPVVKEVLDDLGITSIGQLLALEVARLSKLYPRILPHHLAALKSHLETCGLHTVPIASQTTRVYVRFDAQHRLPVHPELAARFFDFDKLVVAKSYIEIACTDLEGVENLDDLKALKQADLEEAVTQSIIAHLTKRDEPPLPDGNMELFTERFTKLLLGVAK